MPEIFLVSSRCDDLRQTESSTVAQQQNDNEPGIDPRENKGEQIVSFYELLSNECELEKLLTG